MERTASVKKIRYVTSKSKEMEPSKFAVYFM